MNDKELRKCESCGEELVRASGLFAITGIKKNETGKISFTPGSGIPVVLFFCSSCGRLYPYLAEKLGEVTRERESDDDS